jgi:hypothetical protein
MNRLIQADFYIIRWISKVTRGVQESPPLSSGIYQ